MKHTQLSLFDTPTFNTVHPQKEAMNQAARRSGLSRDQIVDKMNALAVKYGVNLGNGQGGLTTPTLEKWLNPSDPSRQMPARAIPIFCAVCDDPEPLDVLARPAGYQVIGDNEQRLLKWARAYQKAKAARGVMRRLEMDIENSEDLE